jgi:hypothetical protein
MAFQDEFFGGARPEQQYYNPRVTRNLNYLGRQFQDDDAALRAILDRFSTSSANALARYRQAGDQAGLDYDALFQANRGYDPLETYDRIRAGNLAALRDFSGELENRGSRQDKLALAALGMGGRPDSSYATALRADRVSSNIAPVLGNIMSSLGSDTATIGNQRAQNLSQNLDLIGLRTQAPLTGYGMELDPLNALLALRGSQTGLLGQQAGVARDNSAGWYQKPGIVDYWDRAMQSASRTASTVGQWASLMGGLGVGGMPAFSGAQQQQQGQGQGGGDLRLGQFTPSGGGGGFGGGGGIDLSAIASIISQLRGGGGGGGINFSIGGGVPSFGGYGAPGFGSNYSAPMPSPAATMQPWTYSGQGLSYSLQ